MLSDFERGQKLGGRYLIKGRLESGGMGEVYVARDESLSRDVAIKRVRIDSDITPEQMPMYIRRFKQEAMSVAKLRHPNIVTVHDVQQAGDSPYIVMEYFKGGQPLTKWGGIAKPTIAQWLGIAKRLFSALHHAHSRGLLHRDIKSANVLARGSADADEAEVLLIDWGIALMEGATRLTLHTGYVGTPGAIDPAVIRANGAGWSQQSDLYALGALLYQCLCGRKPHNIPKDTPPLNLHAIYAENKIVRPHEANPEIDGDLQTFLLCLLETWPERRPPSARAALAMVEALERGDDVDFDGLCSKYPSTPLIVDEDEVEEVGANGLQGEKRGTVLRGEANSVADDLLADFGDDAPKKPPTRETKRERAQADDRVPTASKLVGVEGLEGDPISGLGSEPKHQSSLDARLEQFREDEPPPQKGSRRWMYGIGAVLTLALLVAAVSRRQQALDKHTNPTPAPIEAMDPSELQRREQEPAALDKLAAGKREEVPSLGKLDANTRAEYDADPNHIGGTMPPTPAALRGRTSGQSAESRPKEPAKIDRSMRPSAIADDVERAKNDVLPIKYGTRTDVRLTEAVDTSSGEPVKAKLLQSVAIDETRAIPAGSTLFGKASFRVTGGVARSEVHFDQVLYPTGEQHRIAAVAIRSDGTEGLAAGVAEFQYGDPEGDSDTVGKAGAIGKDAAIEGLSSLPGGNAMSGALKAAADETADAISKGKTKPRKKTRMLVQKDATLTLRFQPLSLAR